MPPRLPRVAIGRSRICRLPIVPEKKQICSVCCLSRILLPAAWSRRPHQLQDQRRWTRRQSDLASEASAAAPITPEKARINLHDALIDLQKHSGRYVNISRLQLALRGLQQSPGQETIRVAILGLADGGNSLKKAKELLQLVLADPLKIEEEWERILTRNDPGGTPLLVRVGHNSADEFGQSSRLVRELNVLSPMLKGHKLEILVLEIGLPSKDPTKTAEWGNMNSFLVPTIEIPTSNTGRYTPVTTPVHKCLIVGDGIRGAASLLSYPNDLHPDIVGSAVNLRISTDQKLSLPFEIVDVELGAAAVKSFRQSVDNAMDYERDWFASGIPEILSWLKSGTSSEEGFMKPPLWKLIHSILADASIAIRAEKLRQVDVALSVKVSPSVINSLRQGLSLWAERAHTELRDQLDIAFNSHRWRKLGWWKLFWRVDDVSMIATDILNQRFLTDAEKEVIFLAGRIEEAGIFQNIPAAFNNNWAYKPVEEEPVNTSLGSHAPPPRIQDLIEIPKDDLPRKIKPQPWPLDIPATRAFLSSDTIPALQALAQKVVFQTLTTSIFSSAFAGLIYISTLSTSLYEAGGVAALGIIWSLRRMQGKWETARKFWEGEVREEGRKAVRGVESVVGAVLMETDRSIDGADEFEDVQRMVARAESALEACK